jgi:hypothetical protein
MSRGKDLGRASGRETLSLEGADGALKTLRSMLLPRERCNETWCEDRVPRNRLTTRKTRQAVYNWLKRLQEKHLQEEPREEPLIGPDGDQAAKLKPEHPIKLDCQNGWGPSSTTERDRSSPSQGARTTDRLHHGT